MAQTGSKSGTRRVNRTEPASAGSARSAKSAGARRAKTAQKSAKTASSRRRTDAAKNKITKTAARTQSIKEKLVRMGEMDYTLLFLIILVVAIGIIVMLSASAPSGNRMQDDSYYYFKRQIVFIVMGFVGMLMVSRINLDSFLKHIPKGFIICIILLILVLIPGIGVESHGARRWLNIPLIQLQPSELMKPMIAMYIAYLVKIGVINLKELRSNMVCAGIISLLLYC